MTSEEYEELLIEKKEEQPIVPIVPNDLARQPNTINPFYTSPITINPQAQMFSTSSTVLWPGVYTPVTINSRSNHIQLSNNEMFEAQRRQVSSIHRVADLTVDDREEISIATENFINNEISTTTRVSSQDLAYLVRRVESYIVTYIYRWYPYLIHPRVSCIIEKNQSTDSSEIRIMINDMTIEIVEIRMR